MYSFKIHSVKWETVATIASVIANKTVTLTLMLKHSEISIVDEEARQ